MTHRQHDSSYDNLPSSMEIGERHREFEDYDRREPAPEEPEEEDDDADPDAPESSRG